jgi:hypothetical protein
MYTYLYIYTSVNRSRVVFLRLFDYLQYLFTYIAVLSFSDYECDICNYGYQNTYEYLYVYTYTYFLKCIYSIILTSIYFYIYSYLFINLAVLSLTDYEEDQCHYGSVYTYTVPDEDGDPPLYEFNIDCYADY